MKGNLFLIRLVADPSYRLGDPIIIRFQIENTSEKSYQVLKWGTPLEGQFTRDCFIVERDGGRIPYDGKLVSRSNPTIDSYVVVSPGEVLEEHIDLSDGYAIDGLGHYSVTLNAFFLDVFEISGSITHSARKKDNFQRQKLQHATVHFEVVEGAEPRLTEGQIARKRSKKLSDINAKVPSITGGTANEQAQVLNAHNNAQYFAALAVNQLNSATANANALYQTWFGAFNQGRYNTRHYTDFTNDRP